MLIQHVRLILAILALLLSVGKPVWSDSRIVYSAQRYQWVSSRMVPGYSRRLVPQQRHSHLYLADQNGSHRVRITSGPFDDIQPSWSPDHTRIAFLRQNPLGTTDLCSLSVEHRQVSRLYQIGNDVSIKYAWSPRSNLIALTSASNAPYDSVTTYHFAIIADATHIAKSTGVREFAWSPDNRHIFLRHSSNQCEILGLASFHSNPIPSLRNPVWLNDSRLLGIKAGPNPRFYSLDLNISRLTRYNLVMKGGPDEEIEPLDAWNDGISWHRSPTNRANFVLQVDTDMSDGEHSWCYTVILGSSVGIARSVGPFEFAGYSPNGRKYALIKSDEWIGPYKRGGARLGRLQVRNISGKHVKWLTRKLEDVYGASWFIGA